MGGSDLGKDYFGRHVFRFFYVDTQFYNIDVLMLNGYDCVVRLDDEVEEVDLILPRVYEYTEDIKQLLTGLTGKKDFRR
jgi:hypothetical protein